MKITGNYPYHSVHPDVRTSSDANGISIELELMSRYVAAQVAKAGMDVLSPEATCKKAKLLAEITLKIYNDEENII